MYLHLDWVEPRPLLYEVWVVKLMITLEYITFMCIAWHEHVTETLSL